MRLISLVKRIFLITFISILINGCNSTEPDISKNSIELKEIDVSCTEAWLKIETEDINSFTELTLIINNENKRTFEIESSDTVLCIDSLKPATDYNVKIEIEGAKSSSASFRTLATTNNNFTFEKYYLGGASSSYIKDVAIIDENNIWAVGDITEHNNEANEFKTYGFAKWNGAEWKLLDLKALHKNGKTSNPRPRGIHIFDKDNIWFTSGSILHWNGKTLNFVFSRLDLEREEQSVEKIWGSAPDNIYAVGYSGTLVHYNGKSWKQIDTGTDLDIQDIWGDYDELTGEWEILAVASDRYQNNGRKVLKIEGGRVIELITDGLPWSLKTLWFKSKRKYLVGGDGIFNKNDIIDELWSNKLLDITRYYTYRISGNSLIDITICGAYGELLHYNGERWESFHNETGINGKYYSIDIKGNIIAAGGQHNNSACIIIGRR